MIPLLCNVRGPHFTPEYPILSASRMSDPKYLSRASLEGLAGEIFKLVSRGATPEQWAGWLRVPLEHAAADGNIGLFNELIGAGADGSAGWRGCEGRTLFDAAAVGGNEEVVSALVAAGAGPDVNVVSASSGKSALYLATSLGHEDAARRLVMAGARVSFYDANDKCYVIHQAARYRCEELVNDLLDAGADPNINVGFGTPLHFAAEIGSEEIVSTLLTRGADKDAPDAQGMSPLMMAAHTGQLAVVKLLLAADADAEIRDRDQSTALIQAASRGHVGVVKVILGQEVDVDAADDQGCAALHVAADCHHVCVIDALVEAGADIELKDSAGLTPLCLAACSYFLDYDASSSNKCTTMRVLLRHGANPRVQDDTGYTPLHHVCSTKSAALPTAVDLLLQHGADETTVNDSGDTAAQMLEPLTIVHVGCTQEDVERGQLLLTRAPNDRAWRRRRWLVMLRFRASRAKTAERDNRGGSGSVANATHGNAESGRSKMARGENDEGGVSGVAAKAGDGCLGGEDGSLGAVVASLLGLELEGVFRTVVGFL